MVEKKGINCRIKKKKKCRSRAAFRIIPNTSGFIFTSFIQLLPRGNLDHYITLMRRFKFLSST